jgi:hypothetical protein
MDCRTPLRGIALSATLALTLAAGPTYAGTSLPTASRGTVTSFALKASGFGTRTIGGQVPVGSDRTGAQYIGCTDRGGRSRTNDVASVTLPGLGIAHGVRTHVWTTARGGVVAAHSRHTIASLVLDQSQLGSLALTAITSSVTAYHDGTGFHSRTATRVGDLTFTPATGPAQSFPAPTPDQPLSIPGVATIYAGRHVTRHSSSRAIADSLALRIDILATGTTVQVAHSRAEIDSGLVFGVFHGHSAATHVITAANDLAESGPNPLTKMPCQGTNGRLLQHALASVDLGGQVVVTGASSSERGNQGRHWARGTSHAEVARLDIGGGQLVVDGIVADAHVRRTTSGVTRTARGTQLGTVTVGGQQQAFPATGILEIPGVAKLERAVVRKTPSGISVIGLRVTLLDGSGAVVDLAEAQLAIHRLG